MNHPTDVADEVTAQRLTVGGRQVLPLEPILVSLLLAESHLGEGGEIGKRKLGIKDRVLGRAK